MSETILKGEEIAKSFQSGVKTIQVLRGVSLSLEAGGTASIQGESGSGKSTLLNILSGLEKPDAGIVAWDGKVISEMGRNEISKERGRLIGMVFQSYYLVPEIRAIENVVLGGRVAKVGGDLRSKSQALLERVGLADRMKSLPATLSGGERQRVAIARALISEPKALLADEPTGNLDERTGDSIMELLLEICRETKTALALVTHNNAYARMTDQQWLLREGNLALV